MSSESQSRRRTVALAAICLPLLLLFGWVMVHRLAACPKGIRTDFVQEWTSARNYWTGRPIYWSLEESFREYFGPEARTELRVNAHPPAAVVAALPFGWTDYRSAWLIWNIVSLGLLGFSLWLLMRPVGLNYSKLDSIPFAALLLASNPLAQQVVEGQMNLVLLALVTGAWAADRQERSLVAGSLIGLAAALKLFPALLVVYFVARRRWWAVASCGLSFIGSNLLAAGLFGLDIYSVYVLEVMPQFAHYGNNVANASLPGLCSTLFIGMRGLSEPLIAAPFAAKICKITAGAGVAVLCGWKAARASDVAGRDIAFAAATIGILLASPITWGHSFVILVLPLLILWRQVYQPFFRVLLAVCTTLLWLVRPGWIWNAVIPGFEAFSLGIAPAEYRISGVMALTAASFLTYALVLLFALALVARPSGCAASRRIN